MLSILTPPLSVPPPSMAPLMVLPELSEMPLGAMVPELTTLPVTAALVMLMPVIVSLLMQPGWLGPVIEVGHAAKAGAPPISSAVMELVTRS